MFSSQMNRWWKKTTTTTPPLQQKYVRLDDNNNNNNNTEMKGNTQDMFWHKLWKSERAVNNWNTSLAWSRLTYSFVTRSVNRQALFFNNIVIISISHPYLKHSMCFAGKSFDSFPQERVLHFINSFTSATRIHTILFFFNFKRN